MRGHGIRLIAAAAAIASVGGLSAALPSDPIPSDGRANLATPTPPRPPGTFKQKARQTAKARAHKRHRRMKHGVR